MTALKIPPQSIQVEDAIIGSLMIDVNAVFIGMSRCFPELFYKESNGLVFRAIQNLFDQNKRIDIITVSEQLRKNETLEMVGGNYELTKLTSNVISGANIENHINLLCEFYLKREAIRLSGDLISEANSDCTDAFEIVNRADAGFQNIQEKILGGNSKGIEYFGMEVLRQHDEVKVTGVLGVKTGFSNIDRIMCGLVSPDLIILAARPGQGKTAFMLSLTYNTSVLSNIPCAWFSLEMDGVQLVRRLVSIDTGINHAYIRNGQTQDHEAKQIQESVNKISNCKIFIEDKAAINVRDIRTRANLLKKRHGIKYIVVDYLQLMKGVNEKGQSRENIVSDISRSLKELAKELKIPVIALSQLSREVEKRPDKIPQLSDLRESGGIEQDADEVLFIMRPEYYQMENDVSIGGRDYSPKGLAVISIAKNRHGATENTAINFNGPLMRFSDYQQTPF